MLVQPRSLRAAAHRPLHHEANFIAAVGGYLAEGIRRAILTTALTVEDEPGSPGIIIVRRDNSIESITPSAKHWLAELYDPTSSSAALPLLLSAVDHARSVVAGQSDQVPTVRIPTRTGGWVRAHDSLLEGEPPGRIGVVLATAGEPRIASLIVEAYGLSKREQDLTRLVLHGLSTREIAGRLYLSEYTVQDHLKKIFDKDFP